MGNRYIPSLRKHVTRAPKGPGVYRWKDAKGTVLYVGKAANLRERMRSYVTEKADKTLGPWKLALRSHLREVEWTVVRTELEALILETNLIKELKPKYNVVMKDDKNYVYLEVTAKDRCPRIEVVRRMENADARYFGPFLSSYELKRALDVLQMLLAYRACDRGIDRCNKAAESGERRAVSDQHPTRRYPLPATRSFRQEKISLKPCLEYQIGKCNGLCIGATSPEEYRTRIDKVMDFFKGNRSEHASSARELMASAASEKKFERAAKLRDALSFIEHQREGQIVSDPHGSDLDVVGIALSHNHAVAVVLRVRAGKLIGEETHALRGEPETIAEALTAFLPQYTETQVDVPPVFLIPEDFSDRALLEAWCTQRAGKRVRAAVPERGRKSQLLDLATTNAAEKLRAQEAAWETAARNIEDALKKLQEVLGLPALPKRIEGYDISHLGGTETVGSMVVMKSGKPSSEDYRSFTLRTVQEGEIDDYKALREVLRRRLRYLSDERKRLEEQGISITKARKNEQKVIEEVSTAQAGKISDDDIDYRRYIVARKDEKIVGFARIFKHPGNVHHIRSLWVDAKCRGMKLGQMIIRELLKTAKKQKVYVIIDPQERLEDYYTEIGFEHTRTPPPILQEVTTKFCKEHPSAKPGTILVHLPSKQTTDVSLGTRPDLLVIDGGKGQLSAALAAMKEVGVVIRVIALAKRQEEVFVPGRSQPVIFPKDAPAKFLLMRLRDEAHRFSNRHREKRLAHRTVASALDSVPGIGPKTKTDLLLAFGTVTGVREASDGELRGILTEAQWKAVRRALK